MGCATPRSRSCSTRWERICGKSRNCSTTRISARPCAIPMSAMNRHGRRRQRSVTLWSENAAAGTTHPAHNNEYYCTPCVPLINPLHQCVEKRHFTRLQLLAGCRGSIVGGNLIQSERNRVRGEFAAAEERG